MLLKRISFILFLGGALALTTSCEKKTVDESIISPTFGGTGNPNPNSTITGNVTFSTMATDNSTLSVGGVGWTNPSCGSTSSVNLTGYYDSTTVVLSFNAAATSGTYAITSIPTSTSCALTLVHAPNQPSGVVWYGNGGYVSVTTSTSNISAKFIGVTCVQSSFNYPVVYVSGVLGCTQ